MDIKYSNSADDITLKSDYIDRFQQLTNIMDVVFNGVSDLESLSPFLDIYRLICWSPNPMIQLHIGQDSNLTAQESFVQIDEVVQNLVSYAATLPSFRLLVTCPADWFTTDSDVIEQFVNMWAEYDRVDEIALDIHSSIIPLTFVKDLVSSIKKVSLQLSMASFGDMFLTQSDNSKLMSAALLTLNDQLENRLRAAFYAYNDVFLVQGIRWCKDHGIYTCVYGLDDHFQSIEMSHQLGLLKWMSRLQPDAIQYSFSNGCHGFIQYKDRLSKILNPIQVEKKDRVLQWLSA